MTYQISEESQGAVCAGENNYKIGNNDSTCTNKLWLIRIKIQVIS